MANAQINVKFIINRRGGRNLSHDGFIYRQIRKSGDRTFWRCSTSGCSASLSTLNDIPVNFGRHPHTHASDPANVVAKQIMNQITNRCAESVRPIPSIFDEELNQLRDNEWDDSSKAVVQHLPTFYSAKSSLYRARRKQTPPLPKTMTDINLKGRWTETSTGEQFLLFDDGEGNNRILAFATSENLADLAASDVFFSDGTFYTCPTLFHQIYSIHTQIDGIMTPMIYALLPGKSQTIYTRFFTLLQEHMTNFNIPFQPTTAFVDFEIATHNAIRSVFPGIDVKGCFFHFTQCIWRKAQSTGLQTLYRDNDDVRLLVRRAAALPLIPMERVEDVWFQALEDANDADIPHPLLPFTDYVTEQWVDGDKATWNHFLTEGPRTTNHLEAWHGKLKRRVMHAHPNIYTIIQMFKDMQNMNDIGRIQRDAGAPTQPRKKKYVNIDRRLATLKDRYQTGTIDLMTYADSASQLLHLG